MDNTTRDAQNRKKRVARMKKIIIIFACVLIMIPIILCIVLFVRISSLESKIDNLMSYTQSATIGEQKAGTSEIATNGGDEVMSGEEVTMASLENEAVANQAIVTEAAVVPKVSNKKVYLTFDDGPSDNTNTILDILKQYKVKATFFVIQKTDQVSIEKYKRILQEGHTLAMHSSSHVYAKIYNSLDDYIKDVSGLQDYLYSVTGYKPTIYRFPGGSSNTVSKISMNDCAAYLNSAGITYFDWNVSSGDAATGQLPADTITNNIISGVEQWDSSVVLMHDANEKMTTVQALPGILQKLIDMGDEVLPITEKTTPVHHIINK